MRTPDERFDGLFDFPIAANYLDNLPGADGLRLHCMEAGHVVPEWGEDIAKRALAAFSR